MHARRSGSGDRPHGSRRRRRIARLAFGRWVAGLWLRILPVADWATYVLAMATLGCGLVICWLIALRVVDRRRAFFVVAANVDRARRLSITTRRFFRRRSGPVISRKVYIVRPAK